MTGCERALAYVPRYGGTTGSGVRAVRPPTRSTDRPRSFGLRLGTANDLACLDGLGADLECGVIPRVCGLTRGVFLIPLDERK